MLCDAYPLAQTFSHLFACDYHQVRHYLNRQPQFPLSLQHIDVLMRQNTSYRDVIDRKTK